MTSEKMTVHKALVELKTLDARIGKEISGTTFVVANKLANAKISGVSITEHSNGVKASYQKVKDLIARRKAIKSAVVLSNARTAVVIDGAKYTVAEAIEMKNHGIPLLQSLLTKLGGDYRRAQREAEGFNGDELERRADAHIANLYGNTDMKSASEEVKRLRSDFIAAQTYEILDPASVKTEMEKLENEINTFTVDVDSALSVSNALTEIEISY